MSISKIVALEEGNPLNSDGADLAESINSTIDVVESPLIGNQKLRNDIDNIPASESSLTPAQVLFDKQASENIGMTYIVSGDSNRSNKFNDMIEYYNVLLGQAGVSVIDNSRSGQSGDNWLNNASSPTVDEAIAATPGTGETTILEYSFGPNDSGADAEIKAIIKTGVETYLTAKPDATVVLCSPVRTSGKYGVLIGLYEEIATELGLQLITPHVVMEQVDADARFKQDAAHLNKYGSQRLLHFILSGVVSEKVRSSISIPDLGVVTPPNVSFNPVVQHGYWSYSTGELNNLDTWRCSEKLAVEPNYTVAIDHGGNKDKVYWYDIDGAFIGANSLTPVDVGFETVVPAGAYGMGFSITDEGTAYDALNYDVKVAYVIEELSYMTPEEVNLGMSAGLPRFNTLPVDSDGKTGVHGQFLMSLGATKTRWVTPVVVSTSPPTGNPAEGELVYHYANNNTVTTYVNVNGAYVPSV